MIRIGRPVIVMGIESNGQTEHAAIITRVHGKGPGNAVLVNLVTFPDCGPISTEISVPLFSSESEAAEYQTAQRGEQSMPPIVAYYDAL